MRIMIRSGFDSFTGYGGDAVDLARFLERAGADVVPMPTSILPGLPGEFLKLLAKDPTGSYDVALTFAPPFDIHPEAFARLGRRAVGYSMWERSKLVRADMEDHGWDMRRKTFWSTPGRTPEGDRRGLDLMIVTCPMNVSCFANLDDGLAYEVVPCGIDSKYWPVVERDRTRRLTFGMIGMLTGRKDPFVAIDAFRELKEEHPGFDAELQLKTSCPGLHPKIAEWIPGITIHDRAWPKEQVREWYSEVDVLLSTSRGEGNNKPAMEFMATGGTVIATEWSGHMNWLHPSCTYPLRGTLVPTAPGSEVEEFRADKEHLKELMLRCWKERAEVAEKGKTAASMIRSSLSWEVVVTKMLRVLSELG